MVSHVSPFIKMFLAIIIQAHKYLWPLFCLRFLIESVYKIASKQGLHLVVLEVALTFSRVMDYHNLRFCFQSFYLSDNLYFFYFWVLPDHTSIRLLIDLIFRMFFVFLLLLKSLHIVRILLHNWNWEITLILPLILDVLCCEMIEGNLVIILKVQWRSHQIRKWDESIILYEWLIQWNVNGALISKLSIGW